MTFQPTEQQISSLVHAALSISSTIDEYAVIVIRPVVGTHEENEKKIWKKSHSAENEPTLCLLIGSLS